MHSKSLVLLLVAAIVVLVGTISVEAGPCSYLKATVEFESDQEICTLCCKEAGYMMGRMGNKCSCYLGWRKKKN